MKILLVQSATYVPPHGGFNKANRLLLEGLAARGHACRVVAPATGVQGPRSLTDFEAELRQRQVHIVSSSPATVVYSYNGVEIHAILDTAQLRAHLAHQIDAFDPTWTLVSEDLTSALQVALAARPGRVVYVAHSSTMLGFGPLCYFPSDARTQLLRQTAGVITVSDYMQRYIKEWSGISAVTIPFPVYGHGPFPKFGLAEGGSVTMINPCAVKGIAIYAMLARQLPDTPFLAVPTWGTTAGERAFLESIPNVRIIPPTDDIDSIFAQTSVLLVPSLWDEAFGLIVVEAMLRGIPVLASTVGGLPEAKLGVDYLLPVKPIERYEDRYNDRRLPIPIVPEQDSAPWLAALQALLSDREHYAEVSQASRAAALAFVERIGISPFEEYLSTLALNTGDRASAQQSAPPQSEIGSADSLQSTLAGLTPERRALLELRLQQRRRQS